MTHTQRNFNFQRWWDWPAALLLIAALLTSTTRLTATRWTEHLALVQVVACLGAAAGLALGQSRFSTFLAGFFASIYGAFVVPWQLGMTLSRNIPWHERVDIMIDRLHLTIDQLILQKPITDNLFFLFLMACLFWTLGAFAGYNLTRHGRPWQIILPAGLALMVVHIYDSFYPVRTWFLAGYIFLALLLLARLHFMHQQSRWKENGTYLPPYVGLDSIRLGLLIAAILLVLAWTAPALASAVSPAESVWRRASNPWNEIRDRMSNVFSALQTSVGVVSDFYGDRLPLGRGNPLSDTVIMTIQAPPRADLNLRYYWRSRVYDFFDSSWTSLLNSRQSVDPENFNQLNQPVYGGRIASSFRFTTAFPMQDLLIPSYPIWINQPVNAKLAQNPDGTVEVGLVEATPYLKAGDAYDVIAAISVASIEELSAAGTTYPEWVTERYLQLPDNITTRTRQLAATITTGVDNPYDQAEAITNYLRENISYSETVPSPPSGQEPIDWFLFDHRRGFCNYYATAEVVLLRSLGIPARLAVGYAQGEIAPLQEPAGGPNPGDNTTPLGMISNGELYKVRHKDAHAWPEVYFPGFGWIEFEPTVSQLPILRNQGTGLTEPQVDPELNRGLQEELEAQSQDRQDPTSSGTQGVLPGEGSGVSIPIVYQLLIIMVGIFLLGLYTRNVRRRLQAPPIPVQLETGLKRIGLQPPAILRRWARLSLLSPLARAYLELNRALVRLGAPPSPTDTPAERAASLLSKLPAAATPIQRVVADYQADTYGRSSRNPELAQTAAHLIRKLSLLAMIRHWFTGFTEIVIAKLPYVR
ncbi:MAG TPA: transglutaminase domain-containing protein [Anaerolineales bacterium]|nr:transglutaminase domain-containing protein [Anaerolineales bacterium]